MVSETGCSEVRCHEVSLCLDSSPYFLESDDFIFGNTIFRLYTFGHFTAYFLGCDYEDFTWLVLPTPAGGTPVRVLGVVRSLREWGASSVFFPVTYSPASLTFRVACGLSSFRGRGCRLQTPIVVDGGKGQRGLSDGLGTENDGTCLWRSQRSRVTQRSQVACEGPRPRMGGINSEPWPTGGTKYLAFEGPLL